VTLTCANRVLYGLENCVRGADIVSGLYHQLPSVVSMVGGLHGVTLLHSMGRAGVEERSYSNGVEWSGVISGHSMELHGVPKGDVVKPNGA
jgi:hypothetical protein